MEQEENSKFHPEILRSAIEFSRVAMKFGDANSFSRISSILAAYDPDLPGEVTMTLLRGDSIYRVSMKRIDPWGSTQKISSIKAIRGLSKLGLKESKDISDQVDAGKTVQIPGEYTAEQRRQFEQDLVGTGYMVV